MVKNLLILILVSIGAAQSRAQVCTTLGQNPSTAFPVCGETVFTQTNVPICTSNQLYVPGCSNQPGSQLYANKNPFWYKFTCYQSGTLGFLIDPVQQDDYDWQLYDITGLDPDQVYTNRNIIVSGNWAGTYGATGASSAGVNFIQCASIPEDNLNSFAQMPYIIEGHNYILLVSHFSDNQSGYTLSFGGGTAVITDPKLPALLNGEAACDSKSIRIVLNKDMKCKSLAANGSDFSLNVPGVSIIAATSADCSRGFDMDTLVLSLSAPMPPGTYSVTAQNGSDGNTLLDNCDRPVAVGDKVTFTVYPLIPTPMDSVTKVKCSPRSLELVFKKGMLCSSVAADGSDFEVIGPAPVTISSAAGLNCIEGLSKKIVIQLSAPIQLGGIYIIRLKNGTDGNTIYDECSQQTPAGSQVALLVKDTVNADFTYQIAFSCDVNVVQYHHDGANGVNSWNWTFTNDITTTSTIQDPQVSYTNFFPKAVQLIVSNGVCSDTVKRTVKFDNLLVADFEVSEVVCPNEPAKFINKTIGNIVDWRWTFDNGSLGNIRNPSPQTYVPRVSTDYFAAPRLIVKNDFGCYDTISRPVKVVFSCFIAVPKAFTPNNDGVNDYLYPLSAYKARQLQFSIYNRFGQLLFQTNDWTQKWDGRFKGQGADPGTYVWMLNYIDETGKKVFQKGTSILIR